MHCRGYRRRARGQRCTAGAGFPHRGDFGTDLRHRVREQGVLGHRGRLAGPDRSLGRPHCPSHVNRGGQTRWAFATAQRHAWACCFGRRAPCTGPTLREHRFDLGGRRRKRLRGRHGGPDGCRHGGRREDRSSCLHRAARQQIGARTVRGGRRRADGRGRHSTSRSVPASYLGRRHRNSHRNLRRTLHCLTGNRTWRCDRHGDRHGDRSPDARHLRGNRA
jgi:hypothetical protein